MRLFFWKWTGVCFSHLWLRRCAASHPVLSSKDLDESCSRPNTPTSSWPAVLAVIFRFGINVMFTFNVFLCLDSGAASGPAPMLRPITSVPGSLLLLYFIYG